MNAEFMITLLAAAVQSGTPIMFATLGEMITERSGILNLGVEGMMLIGAFCAFIAAMATGSPWIGFLAGGVGAMIFSALHAIVCIVFQGNQVVSGLALTIFGTGLANYLGTPYVGTTMPGFYAFDFPVLSSIPVLGDILFKHDALVYVSYLAPFLFWVLMRRTSFGMAIDASGENPSAAKAAGINVNLMRWCGVLIGGFFVGLGGAYLSMAYTHLWTNGLAAGRGWIAVALVIFAFWRPFRSVFGAWLFGGVMAFQLRLQALGTHLPSSLLLMLPYLLTIGVLLFSAIRGRGDNSPGALGVNVEPEA